MNSLSMDLMNYSLSKGLRCCVLRVTQDVLVMLSEDSDGEVPSVRPARKSHGLPHVLTIRLHYI